MMDYTAVTASVTLASGVASSIVLPDGSRSHLLVMASDVAWEVAFSEAAMTANETIPLAAGSSFAIDGAPVTDTTVWVRQSSGGAVDVRHAYLRPIAWDE